jgi:hypothetical protein
MATGLERLLDFSQPLDVQLLDEVCFVRFPRHVFLAVGGLRILGAKARSRRMLSRWHLPHGAS